MASPSTKPPTSSAAPSAPWSGTSTPAGSPLDRRTNGAGCHAPTPKHLQLRSSRAGFDPDTSYWIGASAAARILGVNVTRLNQLVANGRIPYETHADGRRIYRREQLLTVANAREARWH